jgi:hypothetical protein
MFKQVGRLDLAVLFLGSLLRRKVFRVVYTGTGKLKSYRIRGVTFLRLERSIVVVSEALSFITSFHHFV